MRKKNKLRLDESRVQLDPGPGEGRNVAAPTPVPESQAVVLDSGCLCPAVHGSLGGCLSLSETSSSSLQVGAYVFIVVGAITMLMGLLGCIGAVNEVRCLLGLVSRGPGAQISRWGVLPGKRTDVPGP